MPSLKAPVVLTMPSVPLVMVLSLPDPSNPAPRLRPLPPPPDSATLPSLLMMLPSTTLTPVTLVVRAIVSALPFWILTVTVELPGAAVTAAVVGLGADASQVTLCPDNGALLLHAASARLLKNEIDAAGTTSVEMIKAPMGRWTDLCLSEKAVRLDRSREQRCSNR